MIVAALLANTHHGEIHISCRWRVLAIVGNMQSSVSSQSMSQKRVPPLALLRLTLMVAMVFLGLLGMHAMAHPASTPVASSATASHHMAGGEHHELAPLHNGASQGDSQGCADCPMKHDMSAVGCVLALLAILLLVRPPRALRVQPGVARCTALPLIWVSKVFRDRPDLIALGISRT